MKVPQPVTKAVGRVKRDAPPLLIFAGIGGFVTTVYLAVKATPKALEIQKGFNEDTTFWEKTKALAPVYIPTFTVGMSSIACILAGTNMYNRRLGAMAAAYKITETAYKEYKDGVLETIGEKKEKSVRAKIAEKKMEETADKAPEQVPEGKYLFYDGTTGGYFLSNVTDVGKVENKLNAILLTDGYVSVNDVREALGNEPIDIGDKIGWHCDWGLIELNTTPAMTKVSPSGAPCRVITYEPMPGYEFDKMF